MRCGHATVANFFQTAVLSRPDLMADTKKNGLLAEKVGLFLCNPVLKSERLKFKIQNFPCQTRTT